MKLALVMVLMSQISPAYTFKQENRPISSQRILTEATRLGLSTSPDEVRAKKEFGKWPKDRVRSGLDSVAPEPLLLEQQSPSVRLSDAKAIAKTVLFEAVQKRWDRIKQTVLNEFAVDTFDQFKPFLIRELEKIEYTKTSGRDFIFRLNWADVRIDPNLKKVSWVIRIASHLDGNRLEEGVDRIQIPSDIN